MAEAGSGRWEAGGAWRWWRRVVGHVPGAAA